MSKLLDELLRRGTASAPPTWVSAFIKQGEVTIHFSDSTGQVMMRTNASYTSAAAESVGRAEFDAALNQYPSSTQGEIVQPESNHAVLGHILKVTESSNADEACEKYLELLEESVSYVTLLELLECEDGDAAVAKTKKLLRESNAYEGAKVKLKHDIEQLTRAANVAESALTGLLDKMGCKGTGEALEKYRAGRKSASDLDSLLETMGCSNVEEAEEKYLSVATLPEQERGDLVKARMDAEKDPRRVMNSLTTITVGGAIERIKLLNAVEGELKSANREIRRLNGVIAAGKRQEFANILHDGQLYRNATVLLRTEQLIVWRDADKQEHSAPAHQVTLNPDDNGLAAAILSRIGSYEVAPEHIAEMRQQMGWLE